MSDDRVGGLVKEGIGRVQDAAGGLVGDKETQAKGKLNEVAGSVQNAYGQVKDQAQDALEQAKDNAQSAYGGLESYVRINQFQRWRLASASAFCSAFS